jgi:hypothetical protein
MYRYLNKFGFQCGSYPLDKILNWLSIVPYVLYVVLIALNKCSYGSLIITTLNIFLYSSSSNEFNDIISSQVPNTLSKNLVPHFDCVSILVLYILRLFCASFSLLIWSSHL